MHHRGSSTGASLDTTYRKALEGVTHSSKASGATPGGCARTHSPENDDAMTLVHNWLSLCNSDHNHTKARGLLSGT
jgi:hypothetical protein